jgi:hypothetical protein
MRYYPVLLLWLGLSLGVFVVSLGAVLARTSGYYYLPHAVGSTLDRFAAPGEFVWWFTMGGAFEGYPGTLRGFSVLVLANTVSWTAASWVVVFVVKRLLALFKRGS